MYADDAVEIPTISTGHIGVILGLKHARTGDTLIATDAKPINPHVQINTAHKKEKKDKKDKKASKSTTKVHRDENSLQLRPIDVPPPVFFASIEPSSLSEQKHLEEALTMLLREDPSLHVSIDEDTGQTLLSGMGELHLEIARDRLVGDLKAKAEMGKILIAYRETVTGPLSQPIRKTYERDIGGKRLAAAISASLGSTETPPKHLTTTESIPLDSNNLLTISILHSPGSDIDENHSLPAHLHPYSMLLTSLISGTTAALSRGPFLGFPCHSTHVHLTLNPMTDIFSPAESTFPAFTAATRLAVSTALRNAQEESTTQHHDRISLMEPVMNVAINVDESDLGVVVSDISGTRGGNVISLDDDNEETPDLASSPPNPNSAPLQNQTTLTIDPAKIYSPPDTSISPSSTGTADTHHRPRTIRAKVPLNEMVGYLRHLRSLTKGRGTFVMSVDKFEKMTGNRIRGVVGEMRGAEV